MKNSRLKTFIKSIISEVLKENPSLGSELHYGYQGGLDPDINTGGFDAGNGFQTNVWEGVLGPKDHNDLRFWTLRQTDQNPQKAERMAKSISGALSKLRKDDREYLISRRNEIGWDGIVDELKNMSLLSEGSSFKKPADWNKIVDIHKKLSRDKRIKLYDMAIDRITARGFYEIDYSDVNQEIYNIIKQGGLNNLKEVTSEGIQIPFKEKLKKFLSVGTILDAKIRAFYLQNLKQSDPAWFDRKIENSIKPSIINNIMSVYNRDATSINKRSLMYHLKREYFPDNQIQFIVHLVDDMRLSGSGEPVVDMSPKPFISVRQGQEVDKKENQFKTGVTKISDINVDGRNIKYTDDPKAGWGSSTWKIQSNGTIKMVSEDWDTG